MYRAVNDLVTSTWKRCVVQSSAESRIVKYSEAQCSDRTWARYHPRLDYRSGNGMEWMAVKNPSRTVWGKVGQEALYSYGRKMAHIT